MTVEDLNRNSFIRSISKQYYTDEGTGTVPTKNFMNTISLNDLTDSNNSNIYKGLKCIDDYRTSELLSNLVETLEDSTIDRNAYQKVQIKLKSLKTRKYLDISRSVIIPKDFEKSSFHFFIIPSEFSENENITSIYANVTFSSVSNENVKKVYKIEN